MISTQATRLLLATCAGAVSLAATPPPAAQLRQTTFVTGEPVALELSSATTFAGTDYVEIVDRLSGSVLSRVSALSLAAEAAKSPLSKTPPLESLPPGAYQLNISGQDSKPIYFGVLPQLSEQPADAFFAINDHRYTADDFAGYARYGFALKRDLVSRQSLQPSSTHFDWSVLEERLALLRQTESRASLIVAYSPEWDRPRSLKKSPHTPPFDEMAFSRYVEEASRLAPLAQVPMFEIWNEPNTTDFFKGTAEQYASLLKRAYSTAKRVSPDRIVHMGGLAGFDWEFLDRLEQSGALAYTDAIVIHPYTWGEPDLWLWEQLGRLARWRDRVIPDLPIYCNEWGFEADSHEPRQLRAQAEKLVRHTTLMKAAGVSLSGYYLWTQGRFRLFEGNGAPRPAAIAQYTQAHLLSGARYFGRIPLETAGDFAFCFVNGDRNILVAWTQNDSAFLPSRLLTAQSRVLNLFGRFAETDLSQPTPLSRSPLFIDAISRTALASIEPPGFSTASVAIKGRNPRKGWQDFRYPQGSQTLAVSSVFRVVDTWIHNSTHEDLKCAVLVHPNESVEIQPLSETSFMVPAGSQHAFRFKIRSLDPAIEEPRYFSIEARLAGELLPPLRVRIRSVEGNCWEFAANSFEDIENRVTGKNIKTGPRRLWTTGEGGEVVWRFDLDGYKSARLHTETTPRTPARSTIQFSSDGQRWLDLPHHTANVTEWDCSRFAGGPLYVRYSSGTVPGAALHKLTVYANRGKSS